MCVSLSTPTHYLLNLYLHSWRESCQWKPYWPRWCAQDWIEALPGHYLCTVWPEALLASDSLSRHYNHHWQTNSEGQRSQGLIPNHLGQLWKDNIISMTRQIRLWNICRDLHTVLCGDSTGGSVSAVESVLQVNACLSYQIVPSDHVVVIDQHC